MSEPAVSVIIPTCNRAGVLELCLAALERQDCDPALFEVIVCDDGSQDGTPAVAGRFAARHPRFRFLRQENSGANAARNRAIRAAKAPLLLIINDDTIATPRLVGEHLRTHAEERDERVAVVGRVTVSPTLPPSRLAPLHLDRAFNALGGRREHDWRAFFTCNVSVARSLVERGGMFEERMRYHEDLELGERLSHLGLRVVYNPDALGYHEHYLTEGEFLAIAEREARSLVTWSRIAPDRLPVLAGLGFAPAMSAPRKLRHSLASAVLNSATIPLWTLVARHCPPSLEPLAVKIYDQVYQAMKRSALRRQLRSTP